MKSELLAPRLRPVGFDADLARIRRAYKRKALELHPDRNLNDTENATRRFAEVQTAYEVISDPQERAWYDTHRDAILSGEDDVAGTEPAADRSGGGHTSANTIFALMSRFNSSVPMDDSPRGFFGILGEFFDQLATEETAACQWAGIAPTEYPPFGRAKDDYAEVAKRFYTTWAGFSTKKTFSWRDKYRLQEAPDRRVRRLMEKENKKFRDEGIREFNDAVLSLVAFVKKRDPRYVPNTQSEAERQQVLRNSAAAQAARSRAANQEKMADYVVPEWAQSRDQEEHNEFSVSEEEDEVEHIECVVCNKIFKSEKQFEAHEKSKKHIKAVQQLRYQMRKENANFDLEGLEPGFSTLPTDRQGLEPENDSAHEDLGEVTDPDGQGETHTAVRESGVQQGTASQSDTEDDEYAPRSTVEGRILNGATTKGGDEPDTTNSVAASLDDLSLDSSKAEGKKIGKAKQKREKKAARQAAEAEVSNSVSISQIPPPPSLRLPGHSDPSPTLRTTAQMRRVQRGLPFPLQALRSH